MYIYNKILQKVFFVKKKDTSKTPWNSLLILAIYQQKVTT